MKIEFHSFQFFSVYVEKFVPSFVPSKFLHVTWERKESFNESHTYSASFSVNTFGSKPPVSCKKSIST